MYTATVEGITVGWDGLSVWKRRIYLTISMSKKDCSPDNSACEGFFGRVKNEMFYGIP